MMKILGSIARAYQLFEYRADSISIERCNFIFVVVPGDLLEQQERDFATCHRDGSI
jgi:hypothetical protein